MCDTLTSELPTRPETGGRGGCSRAAPCSAFPLHVQCEIERARRKHKPINSAHEGYAVILEELDEFWDEVKKKRELRDKRRMYDELVQVAAMAQRTAEDVLDTPNAPGDRPGQEARELNSDPPVRSTECYAAAIARLREMADENESTIRCSTGISDERKDHIYQEINICRTGAQWLEEDSAA